MKAKCVLAALIPGLVAIAILALLRLPGGEPPTAYAQDPDDVVTDTHSYQGDPPLTCTVRSCVPPHHIGPGSAVLGIDVNVDVTTGADERICSPLPLLPPEDRLLLAFYYPWYYLDYWSRPDLLDTPLILYDSSDLVAIARHLTWAQAAGLDGFIVSWWGWEYAFFDDNFSLVLDGMTDTDLRATIYFETLSPHFTSTAKVISELEYVLDNYSAHPSLLTRDGRPVIFLYAVKYVPREGGVSAREAWQTIVDQLHADGYNPYLIGETIDSRYLNIFDGLHTYLARQDVSDYENISCQAHQAGKLWAANIYPGYDDRLLDRPVHTYIPRNDGQTYSDTFAAALQSNPDWIVMTSFNEWPENTHIEPGHMYGYEYLSRTAVLAAQFHAWQSLPTVYVDAAYAGPEDGSAAHPYNTLNEAVMAAGDGATLRLASGVYDGPITLARSVTLEGGYDPISWTRPLTANPTIIRGNGSGPVVSTRLGPCSSSPSIVLDGLTITGGDATGATPSGGGVHVQDTSLALVNAVITGNQAQDYGGGVFVEGNSQLAIRASYILSNTASVGGGLFVGAGAQLWLTNTIVARNQATVAGGGLYVRPDGLAVVVNGTLTGNDAPGNGKGLFAWPFPLQTVAITNTIVWDNNGADLRCLGNCAVGYSDVAGGWPGAGNLDADPRFSDPAGGDYHLRHDSPAIDAGDPAGVQPFGPAPAVDIDGDPRPMGAGVDLGADEVGPLAGSTMTVDKGVALLGDVLNYTITLTNTDTSGSLSFWVTDTLSLLTDYVSDSLRASSGTAIYLPPGGTLLLPRILWTGTVTPGQPIYLNFAVAVRHQTALYCADVVNVAYIQTAVSALERSVVTRISDGALDHIAIQDAADGGGNQVVSRTLQTGEALTVYAAGYDGCNDYFGPISVTWQTSGTLEYREHVGDSFTFTPTVAGGEGTIVADDGQGHTDETGLITVVHVPPQISVSPSSLSSTQNLNQLITRSLTISNGNGLTLTYKILPTYTQSFELTYEWDDSFFIDADTSSGDTVWDYYFTPEQIDPRLAGGEVKVTEVEIQSSGVNLADWINWDWEVLLDSRDIGWPEGQVWDSLTSPWSGYDRTTPCQLAFVIGERQNPSSYVYEADHNFVTGATSVVPFYSHVKQSRSVPMQIGDGLHAQAFLWTGDPRVTIQFDTVRLTVRGVVTYTMAGWLSVDPISGTLSPGGSQVIHVVFDSRSQSFDVYHTAIIVQSNDPDNAVSIIPATLTVNASARIYLPLLMRNASTS